MKVRLTRPGDFKVIGQYIWNMDILEQDVDVSLLGPSEIQALNNCLRVGTLVSQEVLPVKPPVVASPRKDGPYLLQVESPQAILSQTLASIKKEASRASVAQLRLWKSTELQGKNRKTLLAFLDTLIERHEQQTRGAVGSQDVGTMENQPKVRGVGSPQVSDIIDSDIETIEILIK